MISVHEMLERQAAWQAARRDLPWPEKIRMAEILRDAALLMQGSKPDTICANDLTINSH